MSTDDNGRYRVEGLPGRGPLRLLQWAASPLAGLQSEWYDERPAPARRDARSPSPSARRTRLSTPSSPPNLNPDDHGQPPAPEPPQPRARPLLGFEESEGPPRNRVRDNTLFLRPARPRSRTRGSRRECRTVTVRGHDWHDTVATTTRTWTVDPLAPGETVEGTVPAGGILASDSLGARPTSARNPMTSAVDGAESRA